MKLSTPKSMPVFLSFEEQLAEIRALACQSVQDWADQFLDQRITISRAIGQIIKRGNVMENEWGVVAKGIVSEAVVSSTNLSITFRIDDRLVVFPTDSPKLWRIGLDSQGQDNVSFEL